jgi:PAS domain S-box-containing protein
MVSSEGVPPWRWYGRLGQVNNELNTAASPEWCEAILDSLSEGVFTVDKEWRLTSFNRAAEKILGITRADAIGRPCDEVLRADICKDACALRYTLATGSPISNFGVHLTTARGERVAVSISTALLRSKGGTVVGAVETFRDLSAMERLRHELDRRYTRYDIVSRNPRMQEVLDLLPILAASDSTVLIEGESGTGKELVARALHNLSHRRSRPLMIVNCGALPEQLLESELFGHRAGAFTGALRDKQGKLAAADGGTVFLDEVGEMSPLVQVKLLRVLEDRHFEPLGEVRTVTTDVRFVAATNHNLADDAARGRFREDLYFRLNVIRLELPPLRDRLEDVPLLADHFLAHLTATRGKEVASLSLETLAALMSYEYPGNVRELQNIVEHAFVLCPGGVVCLHHLPERLRVLGCPASAPLPERMARIEAQLIGEALRTHGGSRAATARHLGIHKTTLFKKLRKYRGQIGEDRPPRSPRRGE